MYTGNNLDNYDKGKLILMLQVRQVISLVTSHPSGPEEAQGLQRFWPLQHLAFKFLNLSIMLTCHVANVFTS